MPGNRSTLQLAAFAASLSLVESLLVLAGVLPPVLAYSPGNLAFSFLTVAAVLYAAVSAAGKGLKEATLSGSAVSFAAASTLCIVTLLSHLSVKIPVLGAAAPDTASLLLLLALILTQNVLLGAIVSAIAAWAALKLGK